jgi:hypothetical protein
VRKTDWLDALVLHQMNWTPISKVSLMRWIMEDKTLYKVIVSDHARLMLASQLRFLAQKSPAAARRVNKDLIDAIRYHY